VCAIAQPYAPAEVYDVPRAVARWWEVSLTVWTDFPVSSATTSLCKTSKSHGGNMLWTICVVLVVLWLLGMVSSYTLGGFIHILLVLAVIVLLVRLVQGRRLVS